MKTPDEIKKGLSCIGGSEEKCSWCAYNVWDCVYKCNADALAYIQQLESRLAQVERERDAAVVDLSNSCSFCKHMSGSVDEPPCTDCFHPKNNIVFAPITRTKFEWRGVCPENTKENPPC